MPTGRDDARFRVKTGSHGQTGKMTRLTHLGQLQFSTPVTFGATAPAHGVGFRLADTANHEALSRLAPAG
jgi:hypothetical protein